ncbi:disease resistance protein RGA3 [Pyrus ussuriensis x Pyrus communis]|uniref:Disease resistance protein RGA3 n=1 Tax=Pyrus ussuriensis x Pyrus communis TaxID=2448454 RepID=A0A5N5HR47_9ROSA|nr:disease resistance protein RGA3 [Pyrus ussuriensis x Pyrus communis]
MLLDQLEKLVLNTKKDIEEFAGNLEAIQAVLEDEEQRQFKEASVRIWLDQLKDISFQMVDKKKKVSLSAFPSCFCFCKANEVIFLHDIASKIKDLNDKLSVIDEQRKRFEFQQIERGIQEFPERHKTSSVVVMSEIAKSISDDGAPSSNKLDCVLQFLLVLDDVRSYNSEKWERLRAPLIQNGALGTTSDTINLGELSEQYCLSIFNHMTFFDREVGESKAFEDISNKIVEKCNLMHNKRTRRAWLGVLNSKIWDREEVDFSKDYEFERECLINLWMAQDYLNAKGNEDEGEIDDAIFDNLVARSFFQDLKKDSVNGKIIGCKMHDIVYDFVQSLIKNECAIIDVEDVGNEIEVLGEKIRHLTLRLKFDFNFILQLKCLRTCLRTLNLRNNGISKVPREIGDLIHMSLKHLYVKYCHKLKYLPKGILRLKNLKTIDECVLVCGGDDDTAALRLRDLKFLNLQCSLNVRLKWNVKDEREIEKAQLWDMKQLFHLKINCMTLGCTCPSWMMSLHNLRSIFLLGCKECKFMPPLGKLSYLENLTLWGMEKVKKVGGEFLGIVNEEDEATQNRLHAVVERVGSRCGRVEQRGI